MCETPQWHFPGLPQRYKDRAGDTIQRISMLAMAAMTCAGGVFGAIDVGRAQSVTSYRCADGTRFMWASIPRIPAASCRSTGGEVVLARRFAVSGPRYSGAGVTLTIGNDGRTRVRHARRPTSICE
ncbi:conserved hypothetical protein [Bradyrhizobium sp. ORS 278]|nr:conserved hypothetical protein [Bradyrhizobium sp. ORS 278]